MLECIYLNFNYEKVEFYVGLFYVAMFYKGLNN